jgi:hypothetical protein
MRATELEIQQCRHIGTLSILSFICGLSLLGWAIGEGAKHSERMQSSVIAPIQQRREYRCGVGRVHLREFIVRERAKLVGEKAIGAC